MSYTRWNESGHYIYGGADYVDFNGVAIPDDEVDVFIYKLFGKPGGTDEEFWERYEHGERVISNFQKGIFIQKFTKNTSVELAVHTAAIAALAAEIWREYYTKLIGAEQVEYMLAKFQSAEQILTDIYKNEYTYFTANDAKTNSLIGYCAVTPKDGFALLSKLYVHIDYRSKGIARSMLDEVIALCRSEYGCDRIRLTVNKHNASAIAVYQKSGFTVVDSVKTDIGGGFFMDDFVMELPCRIATQT
jgi:ribosomal protein S18 acetylase RimI-like enzyme